MGKVESKSSALTDVSSVKKWAKPCQKIVWRFAPFVMSARAGGAYASDVSGIGEAMLKLLGASPVSSCQLFSEAHRRRESENQRIHVLISWRFTAFSRQYMPIAPSCQM